MTEFDESGKPRDLPSNIKKAAWLTAFQVLSREHDVLRSMQDRAIAGYRQCPLCEKNIPWYGDPAAAKLVLDYSRKAKDDYKKETGNAAPGDIAMFFAGIQAEDFQEVLLLVAERRKQRQNREAASPSDAGSRTELPSPSSSE